MSGVTVGLVGLGYWGPNLARNFDHLADLAWLCDFDEGLRASFAARYPRARMTADFAEMLAERFGVPVESFDPFKRVALDANKYPADTVTEVAPTVAVAVGLALRRAGDR